MTYPSLALRRALEDADLLRGNERTWARVYTEAGIVRLQYGVIHSNGMHERAIATRTYDQNGGYHATVHV